MSVLAAAQSAMIRLVGRKPSTLFSSQNQMEMEISDLATDVAVDICTSHDWRKLTKLYTLTGDGVASSFDLPADYDRMVIAQAVHDPNNWFWGYSRVHSLDEWIAITTSGFFGITPGWWIMLGGKIQFAPTPAAGAQATFPYISKNIGLSASGSPITAFTRDDDTFALDERMLTLGIIWRWKAQKGLEYAEDMANFEKDFSDTAARDKGATAIRSSNWLGRRLRSSAAYPWPLG